MKLAESVKLFITHALHCRTQMQDQRIRSVMFEYGIQGFSSFPGSAASHSRNLTIEVPLSHPHIASLERRSIATGRRAAYGQSFSSCRRIRAPLQTFRVALRSRTRRRREANTARARFGFHDRHEC